MRILEKAALTFGFASATLMGFSRPSQASDCCSEPTPAPAVAASATAEEPTHLVALRSQDAPAPKDPAISQGVQPDAVFLVFPTGDRATGNLMVEVMGPAEVPVGQHYEYRIKVSNITKNLVLEDVKVLQTESEGFSIEKSEPKTGQGEKGQSQWTIERLKPGESKEIKVTALSDKEGAAAGCLRVDYKPSLCLATRFVKPQIQLSKSVAERADICRPLEARYTLKNTGSGVARGIKVSDTLPDGLKTAEGKGEVTFDVGDLAAGQSRDFTANLQATKSGTYSSRAVAMGENDLEARSNKPETKIVQAKLAVDIEGPGTMYVDRPATYQVRVDNKGDAPAVDAELRVQADRQVRLVQMSKTEPGGATPQDSGNLMTWRLGNVEPGGHRVISFTTTGRGTDAVEHKATATSACARGGDMAQAATVTDQIETTVVTLPALLLEMVDQVDPVRVGQEEVYTVVVRNQGTGPDHDVKVVCTLPDEFTFVSGNGPTEVKADGQKVDLGTIEMLAPRAKATWTIRVKANKVGDLRNKVELTSKYLTEPLPELEPTRVIGAQGEISPDRKGATEETQTKASQK